MRKVYISGKISGKPKTQYQREFSEAEKFLKSMGYYVVNPASDEYFDSHEFSNKSYREIIAIDIQVISICDTIYMLQGWEGSNGAIVENAFAKATGLTILYQ